MPIFAHRLFCRLPADPQCSYEALKHLSPALFGLRSISAKVAEEPMSQAVVPISSLTRMTDETRGPHILGKNIHRSPPEPLYSPTSGSGSKRDKNVSSVRNLAPLKFFGRLGG